MSKRKLLLLTLGTGRVSDDGQPVYMETQYTVNGVPYSRKGKEVKTNFVAEPIIDFFVPDDIFILGTVKSCWDVFYASSLINDQEKTTQITSPEYMRLRDIIAQNGINTNRTELDLLSEEITEIYARIPSWEKYSYRYVDHSPKVRVILTKYGVNDVELQENYGILRKIEEGLDADTEYEVAFDITHSFRSLPIYNLILFNYIKGITKYKINLTHVYYGNFDVKREMGDKAPIVDLGDLAEVLNLTNGVAEFKDTGNAVSLISLLADSDPLKEQLVRFDLATQLNVFDDIKIELIRLCKIIQKETEENKYSGIREMIALVLKERFLECDRIEISEIENLSDADLKILLTKWYFNQNRMGLGLATGLEALRDICTPAFMEARNHLAKSERTYRENAEAYFVQIATEMEKSNGPKSELAIAVQELGTNLKHYKIIRNIFAHSLSQANENELLTIKKEIIHFKDQLFRVKELVEKNSSEFKGLFAPSKRSGKNTKNTQCRIVLSCENNCNYQEYKNSTNKSYDVYHMKDLVWERLLGNAKSYNCCIEENAFFLYQYLVENLPAEYETVNILLADCEDVAKKMMMLIFLQKLCEIDERVKIFTVDNGMPNNAKKYKIAISMGEQETMFEKSAANYMMIMGEPLVSL